MMCGRSGTCGTSERTGVWQWQSRERGGLLNDIWERNEEARGYEKQSTGKSERGREAKRRERSGAGQNGRTCDSMRFTAALRRFIAPSKHKMPGREACMRVGTPPLHFYRRLPVKLGNIPPISCSRERSRPAISDSLPFALFPVALKRGHWLSPVASSCREVHALLNIANFVRNLLIFFGKEFSEFKSLKCNFFIIFNPVITAIFFFSKMFTWILNLHTAKRYKLKIRNFARWRVWTILL